MFILCNKIAPWLIPPILVPLLNLLIVEPTWYSRHQASAQEKELEAAEVPDVH